jgi:hypothetical protein
MRKPRNKAFVPSIFAGIMQKLAKVNIVIFVLEYKNEDWNQLEGKLMKIKIDYTIVEEFETLIREKEYLNMVAYECFFKTLSEKAGFKKMLEFYKSSFNQEQYKDVLYRALNNKAFKTDNATLSMLYENLNNIRIHEGKISKKLKLIKAFDFLKLEKQLTETLPDETQLDIHIYFVFDGINGGSIIGNDTMLLNAMFWPSSEENLPLIEGILLHEYHHLGLKYWIDKTTDINAPKTENGIEFAKYLTTAILGEGAATYFFNNDDDISPLLVESHGEKFALQYHNSMVNRESNIHELLLELETDYLTLLRGHLKKEDINSMSNKYSFSTEAEPRDKSIGNYMCSVIDKQLGRNTLISCFQKPSEFFTKFNMAEYRTGNSTFKDSFITKVEQIWK